MYDYSHVTCCSTGIKSCLSLQLILFVLSESKKALYTNKSGFFTLYINQGSFFRAWEGLTGFALGWMRPSP